jgi:hypothetical protein
MTTATRVEAAAMMRASWWKVREPAIAFSDVGRTVRDMVSVGREAGVYGGKTYSAAHLALNCMSC